MCQYHIFILLSFSDKTALKTAHKLICAKGKFGFKESIFIILNDYKAECLILHDLFTKVWNTGTYHTLYIFLMIKIYTLPNNIQRFAHIN